MQTETFGMESLIDSITAFLSGLFGLAQGGFDGVNQVMGLLIAVGQKGADDDAAAPRAPAQR
mgnify:CR=1 FL=1